MTDTGRSPRRVLVVEPAAERAAELAATLRALGAEVQIAAGAEEAWRTFAGFRPSHVVAACAGSGKGGEWFLRRLHGEYLGTMPEVYLTCPPEVLDEAVVTEADAYLVTPVASDALGALLEPGRPGHGDSPARQATRLRELYDLSLLGPDLILELDAVVARASLAFQVSDCVVWGPDHEPYWPRSSRSLDEADRAATLSRCRLAAAATTTVIVPASAHRSQSLLAVPFGPPGREPAAGIALVGDEARRFTRDEHDALRVLARRLSGELAWMSAHNRLIIEHEKLRQAALLDPLLGVWTRAVLERSIEAQLSASAAGRVPLALAVLDYHQLRAINDHHGHVIGDAVLTHFASTVTACLRPRDQIGRFGGDELAVLFVDTELDEAQRRTRAILARLEATPFRDGDREIPMVVHAGLTSVDAIEAGGDAAFSRALGAMARARRTHAPLAVEPRRDGDAAEVVVGAPASIPAGSTLGGMYRILHEISRGAMGVVYRGEDLGLGRQVALKVLRADLASDRALVARFRAEAALLASLRHRNLVQVYSLGREGDDVFFVMELVEGEPLATVIDRLALQGTSLDGRAVGKIARELAGALDALHAIGIVHRDVKPDNVLVDRVGDRAVLVDVGIAKRPSDVRDAAGTPGYAAPECFMEVDETPATDVYGLAATTYAMLTGRPPYAGHDIADIVDRQLSRPPERPSALRVDLPSAVDDILLTALAADPPRRYPSATTFAVALARALEPASERSPRSRRPTTPAIPRSDTAAEGTYRLSAPVDPERPSELGHSRAILCRVAAVTLGQELGPGWLDPSSTGDPLRALLEPTLSPSSWQPVEALLAVLGHTRRADDPDALCRRLGAAMTSSTLAGFFGADPATHTPGHLLLAAESYWRRMHSWGQITVRAVEREAMIEIGGVPPEPLLCALLEGSFERIAELGGARDTGCQQLSCATRGDDLCRFVVRWS